MKYQINDTYQSFEAKVNACFEDFQSTGIIFSDGNRNKIKLFDLGGKTINVKSFKIPNLINKIAYKYFRKSKARRSFEYASILLEKGIGTPEPIAYKENRNWLGLKESYYASEHLVTELTFRELVEFPDYPNHEIILRQFTKFCFDLHQKGIEFLDHSSGNTLIKKASDNQYKFFLVDLNRMNFHQSMSFDLRMKNFNRLTPKREMIEVMSNEYAKHYNQPESDIAELMWVKTCEFQESFRKKKQLKKQLKFWKS